MKKQKTILRNNILTAWQSKIKFMRTFTFLSRLSVRSRNIAKKMKSIGRYSIFPVPLGSQKAYCLVPRGLKCLIKKKCYCKR